MFYKKVLSSVYSQATCAFFNTKISIPINKQALTECKAFLNARSSSTIRLLKCTKCAIYQYFTSTSDSYTFCKKSQQQEQQQEQQQAQQQLLNLQNAMLALKKKKKMAPLVTLQFYNFLFFFLLFFFIFLFYSYLSFNICFCLICHT